jgi:WD40 repeat protein/tRNA A-37 threonylcarbamoyl transferase component Bud32
MSDPIFPSGGELEPLPGALVDEVCDRFEAAWKAGQRPQIEQYLSGTLRLVQANLLRELLALELLYRVRCDERPTPEDYRHRFPSYTGLVEAVFREVAPALGPPLAIPGPAVTGQPAPAPGTGCDAHQTGPDMAGGRPGGDSLPAGAATSQPAVPGYEVLGELGRGGMGVVYKARQFRPNRTVALKMIRAGATAGQAELERFLAEAEAVAHLQHPHIVQLFEFGRHEGLPYFTLEYIGGGSLAQKLRGTPLPPAEAARLVEQLARAAHYAHQQGIVHRDLKPGNVLLTEEGTAKVTDFGLAKRVEVDARLTATGEVLGTPSYMAPEQAQGKKEVGPAADVYALGAVLYECLTGRPPFQGPTALDVLVLVVADEPVPPTRLQPGVPRDLETVCLKCLEKQPGRRYTSAEQLAGRLRMFLEGRPIPDRPVRVGERVWKWARRRPAVAAAYALLLVATLLGTAGGAMAWLWRLAEDARQVAEDARQDAVKARQEVVVARYASDLQLAQREWETFNVVRAEQVLDACPTDLRGWEWYHLKGCCRRRRATPLPGHTGQAEGWRLMSVCFSLDGKRLASVTALGGTVNVWDAEKGQELLTLRGHNASVMRVCFSPDGRRLASASSEDETMKVWDATTGRELFTVNKRLQVECLAFSPDGERLASASMDGTVKVWDAEKGQELLTLKGDAGEVIRVCFSPDGKRLASTFEDGTVRVWDAEKGQELLTFRGHTRRVMSVCFSPDGKRLASALAGKAARVWDAATGQVLLDLQGHNASVSSVCFSPDGRRLAGALADKTVRLWDAATGQELLALKGHTRSVQSVCFSPDGKRLASGGGSEVKVWDATIGPELLALKGHTAPVSMVCFSPDGKRLASASRGKPGEMRLWDVTSGQAVRELLGFGHIVWSVCFSPDGKRLAWAGGKWDRHRMAYMAGGEVKWCDAATGQELLALKAHLPHVLNVGCVCFSPDGKRLAVVDSGREWLRVWDAATGQELLALKVHSVWSVCFSPDGKRLASGGGRLDQNGYLKADSGEVKVWDATSGQEQLTLSGLMNTVTSVCFSPDGKRLASASGVWDNKKEVQAYVAGEVKVWDSATGQELLALKGHTTRVNSVCFSPDGKRLASGAGDPLDRQRPAWVSGLLGRDEPGELKVWDAATGRELLALKGHTGAVLSVCFSPDGKCLASGGGLYDEERGRYVAEEVKVWDSTDLVEEPGPKNALPNQ